MSTRIEVSPVPQRRIMRWRVETTYPNGRQWISGRLSRGQMTALVEKILKRSRCHKNFANSVTIRLATDWTVKFTP